MSTSTNQPSTRSDPATNSGSTPDGADSKTAAAEDTETMGFRAVATADYLTAVFEPVSRLVDECRLHLDPTGITIAAVDSANVAMVDLTAPASGFHSFESADCTLGVRLDRLLDILSMADDSSSLVQVRLNQETRKLDVVVDGIEYTMALIDPASIRSEPELPAIEHPVEATVHYDAFYQGFKAAKMVDENCIIEASADTSSLSFRADDQDSVDYELLAKDDEELVGFEMADPRANGPDSDYDLQTEDDRVEGLDPDAVRSVYSLKYLKDMRMAFPSDGRIDLSLGTQLPVELSFALANGDVDVTYLLAPRITT